jgi:hypothetical protein
MSWQLATDFHQKIKTMMDEQMSVAYQHRGRSGPNWVPVPAENTSVLKHGHKLTYNDGVHNWSFQVLIKSLQDGDGSGQAIVYSNGKFNHGYQLTLFILQIGSDLTHQITSDAFIARIAKGVGWRKQDGYHGPYNNAGLEAYIHDNGGDGIYGYLAKMLSGQDLGQLTDATPSGVQKPKDNKKNTDPNANQPPSSDPNKKTPVPGGAPGRP